MEPIFISAQKASQDKQLLFIDIRPKEERDSELGFIPGSQSLPMAPPWDALHVPQDLISTASGIVLTCLSGQRAKLAWRYDLHGKPVFVLEGGTLSWSASGLPISSRTRTTEVIETVNSAPTFLQNLRSCFVAEWIESSLTTESEDNTNPVELLESCLKAEGVVDSAFSIEALHRVMDRLAWHSLRAGTARAKIAHNLNVMLNTLQRLNP